MKSFQQITEGSLLEKVTSVLLSVSVFLNGYHAGAERVHLHVCQIQNTCGCLFKSESKKTTQIFVWVIYIMVNRTVLNTEAAWEDQIVVMLQAKSAGSTIPPAAAEAPNYRIHINLNRGTPLPSAQNSTVWLLEN